MDVFSPLTLGVFKYFSFQFDGVMNCLFAISSRFQECRDNVAAVIYFNCQDFKNNLLCRSSLQNLSKVVRFFLLFHNGGDVTVIHLQTKIIRQRQSTRGRERKGN